jgi:diaminohydroxyphosphoribosylaminopyrimidine deaminase / 5-amino-6-(5-phosphoribosylamino)uracil reductase
VDAHSIRFMQHALNLARKGAGLSSPNPMVGCILVREGQIVGEGFHQYEWRDHAEIVALKTAGEKARGATMYVTLEPCDHTGRTGPCTEAIIQAGVRSVVAPMDDPNPLNSGRGFARLREAGLDVFTGACEDQARKLNESFACWIRTKKPFVTLKSALTLDGQLAFPQTAQRTKKGSSTTWVTSEESRAEVHRMRHAADALLTGIGTILADDPLMTDRSGLPRRRRMLRVILDSKLRLSPQSKIVRTSDDDLLVITAESLQSAKARKLQNEGVELVRANMKKGCILLPWVIQELGRRDLLGVILEAGSILNGAALVAGIVDRLFLFYAPKIVGDNRVPFALAPKLDLPPLREYRTLRFGPDLALESYLRNPYSP